jgi:hypothetical protein
VAGMLPGNNTINNTNLLVASREEIFKKLIQDTEIEDLQIVESVVLEDTPNK